MRKFHLSALLAIAAFALSAPPCAAQIVIPDINRDTIKLVPPPVGFTIQNQTGTTTIRTVPLTLDPRCKSLPEALQRTTPGCH